MVICFQANFNLLVFKRVHPRGFLVLGAKEISIAFFMDLDAIVQKKLDHGRVLGHHGHVEGVLAVVLFGQVDIVDEFRVPFEQPPAQVEVGRGLHEKADVKSGFADISPLLDHPTTFAEHFRSWNNEMNVFGINDLERMGRYI